MKAPSLPYLAFGACGLIWGSTFLVIRVGNDTLAPMWACALRFALAAVVLNALLFLTGHRWPKGEAMRAAFLYGLLEFGVSMPLLYWGETVVPSGLAAVLYAICPVVAMLAARLMKMETLNPKRLGAAFLAFLGVAVIFWRELLQGASATGLLAVLVAAIAAPLAGLFLQRGPKQNAIGSNAVGVIVGLPICLVLSLVRGEPRPIPMTAPQLFPIAYLAIVGSVGAFVIFAWLINRWRATTASFIGVVVPVIAVILGAIFRNESLAPGSLIGAAVVVIGVTIALQSESRQEENLIVNG